MATTTSTVTLTAARDRTTVASAGGRRFPMDVPIVDVDADVVEQLLALDGLTFVVTDDVAAAAPPRARSRRPAPTPAQE